MLEIGLERVPVVWKTGKQESVQEQAHLKDRQADEAFVLPFRIQLPPAEHLIRVHILSAAATIDAPG